MKYLYTGVLFLGIVIILISVSVLSYRNLNNYTEQVHLIRHSNNVLRVIQTVLLSVRDAETGHRGYQLTRDTTYLEPYYQALQELPGFIRELDSLLAYDEKQSRRADTLELLIENQFAIISQILSNAKRSSLYMDRFESTLLAQGKKNMDDIKKVSKGINDEEANIYLERISSEAGFRSVAPLALLGYTLIALVAVSFLFTRVLDALNKKFAAEQKLRENIAQLKKEVQIREERGLLLKEAESLANMGSWKWYEKNDQMIWSDGLYRIWGRHPSAFHPAWESFLENVHAEDKKLVQDFLQNVKEEKKGSEVSYRIEIGGNLKYLLMVAKPREDAEHREIDILGTVLDLTAQKLSESQLKQFTIELKRSNQDLEQFAYVASHDLQEPLRKIRAFGDRLVSKYQHKFESQGLDYIKRMQSASARMQVLIEELLSFSRLSQPTILFEKLDTNDVIREVLEDLESQIKQKEASIKVGKLPHLKGERTQIKRLFQNLISNGIKFHKINEKPVVEVNGRIVKSSEIEFELKIQLPDPEYVRIEVKDEGIGFDEKYSEKIFNIFHRLHGRMEYEGTGIGLAICRKIVANHGGIITARSTENMGSKFIIIFPNGIMSNRTLSSLAKSPDGVSDSKEGLSN